MMAQAEIYVILHNIRSSENVGSIFRTSDAAGVSKVYLTGYTPAPLDRFKRKNSKIAKAALGAEDTVLWESREITDLIQELKSRGVKSIAVEQHPRSIPYTHYAGSEPCAFIFGNEVEGVPEEVIALADSVVEIPMHGTKESLNVSVCAGVILFSRHNFDRTPPSV